MLRWLINKINLYRLVESVRILEVRDGDVLMVCVRGLYSQQQAEKIKKDFQEKVKAEVVLVNSECVEIAVIREPQNV